MILQYATVSQSISVGYKGFKKIDPFVRLYYNQTLHLIEKCRR
jgi:hypothetical protein